MRTGVSAPWALLLVSCGRGASGGVSFNRNQFPAANQKLWSLWDQKHAIAIKARTKTAICAIAKLLPKEK